jgi:Ca2+/Na+ antiporter
VILSGLKKGFIFIREASRLAFKKRGLLKTGSWFLKEGLILTICFLIPLLLVVVLMESGIWQMALIGLICVFFLYISFTWADAASLATAFAFNELETQGTITLADARVTRRKGWKDAFKYGMAYPSLALIKWTPSTSQPATATGTDSGRGWLKGHFLIIPLISIEGLSLREAVGRVKSMADQNLLRFRPGLIKVRLITHVFAWLMIIIGAALGIWLGMNLGRDPFASDLQKSLAAAAGFLLATVIALPAIGSSAFMRSIYHTAIYRWILSIEASGREKPSDVSDMPEILQKALMTQ